jgi:hypothetical protein
MALLLAGNRNGMCTVYAVAPAAVHAMLTGVVGEREG